ncbi:hypothetical protein NYE70_08400 [Paenibacillus sp. FSL R5-0407]|uniref:hypothetical protein n=1 Tax=Paenibacillus sp. FSL R5-0407 TaxID=2975320 RepID=UPI0030F99491
MSKEDKIFYSGLGLVIFSFILTLLFGKESIPIFLFSACSLFVLGYGYYFKSKADKKRSELQAEAELNGKE